MPRRPTIMDLAKAAGVGVATVDRVLNGRAHVSAATIDRVTEAARAIGYPVRGLLIRQQEAALPARRFAFALIRETQPFYRNFAAELERAVAERVDVRGRCRIVHAASQAPDDVAAALESAAEGADALGCVAINHQAVTSALQRITARGVPVFTLLNDTAQSLRHAYLGLENVKVGRIAAWAITSQMREAGKLALFVGGNRWHGHVLRESGFHSYLRDYAPDAQMLNTLVNLDTRQVTYEATIDLLTRHPDLRGIYVAGGGMEGAIAALREMRPPGKVALVVNELTEDSRAGLADRYVTLAISTPLRQLCAELIEGMIAATGAAPSSGGGQTFLTSDLYCPESV